MSHQVDVEQSHRVSEVTIAYYDRMAEAYWDGTRDHDVSQNYTAFLDAIENDPPYSILDLGCGPGRDLHHFRLLGHNAVGGRIDGIRGYGTFLFRVRGSPPRFSHDDITGEPLRRRVCECVAVPRAEPRIAEGIARTLRNLEAPGRPFLLKPERKQRGRFERRPL